MAGLIDQIAMSQQAVPEILQGYSSAQVPESLRQYMPVSPLSSVAQTVGSGVPATPQPATIRNDAGGGESSPEQESLASSLASNFGVDMPDYGHIGTMAHTNPGIAQTAVDVVGAVLGLTSPMSPAAQVAAKGIASLAGKLGLNDLATVANFAVSPRSVMQASLDQSMADLGYSGRTNPGGFGLGSYGGVGLSNVPGIGISPGFGLGYGQVDLNSALGRPSSVGLDPSSSGMGGGGSAADGSDNEASESAEAAAEGQSDAQAAENDAQGDW